MGSTRTLLIGQFLAEATALVALAAVIGLAITELAVPLANALGGWAITIDYSQVVPLLLGITVALGLGAGFYPAVLLAAYRPAQVLAAARLPAGGKMGGRLRQILVLVQFTGAIAFAICTLVIDRQADFLRNADRGFDREGLIIVKSFRAKPLMTKQLAILDTLRAVPGVIAATVSDREPNSNSNSETDVTVPGRNGPNPVLAYENVGRDYFTTYGVKLVAGRQPDPSRPIDDAAGKIEGRTVSGLINQAALGVLGFGSADAAIGHQLFLGDGKDRTTLNIIGVMKDVRFMSPRDPVAPQFTTYHSGPIEDGQAAIRFAGVPRAEMMQRLQAAWRRLAPDEPFAANTADERLEEFYKPDQQHAQLFSAGALLAIAIACIGLYGLAAFSTSRRVQEIGIRKTLGASTRDVLLLLVGQFIRPVLIANALAWPLAWAAMVAWLAGFDERINLSPVYFIVVGVGALLLSTLTVAGQAWRVAHAEPARALRYE
jgi:putative ABC transport system permease protein